MNDLQKVAKEMGVSEVDVLCLAKSVAESMEQDDAVRVFLTSSEQVQRNMIEAYVLEAVKKFERFHTMYLTRPEAREVFIKAVLNF